MLIILVAPRNIVITSYQRDSITLVVACTFYNECLYLYATYLHGFLHIHNLMENICNATYLYGYKCDETNKLSCLFYVHS